MSRTSRERYAHLRQSFWRHPRITALSMSARGVYAGGLSFCADNETDGKIPERTAVLMLADGHKRYVKELVDAGVWVTTEDGYEVAGYLDHNKSKADMEHARKAASDAGKRGGRGNKKAKAEAEGKPTIKGTLYPTLAGTPKPSESDHKAEEEIELTPLPPNGGEEGERPDLGTQVSHLLASGPETPAAAWRLIEMLADLECQPCGAPWIRLGMASQADLRRMTEILDRAREIAPQDPPLRTVAVEWTALIGLIASGQQEHPKAPVPYFRQGFGTFEQRHEVAA